MTTKKELLNWLEEARTLSSIDFQIDWHLVKDVSESGTAIVFHTEEES